MPVCEDGPDLERVGAGLERNQRVDFPDSSSAEFNPRVSARYRVPRLDLELSGNLSLVWNPLAAVTVRGAALFVGSVKDSTIPTGPDALDPWSARAELEELVAEIEPLVHL